jgi:hypothetical protein
MTRGALSARAPHAQEHRPAQRQAARRRRVATYRSAALLDVSARGAGPRLGGRVSRMHLRHPAKKANDARATMASPLSGFDVASTMTARAGSTRHDRREIEMLVLLVNAMRSTGRSPEALN